MNEDWFGAPLERLREIAPIAVANARWIAAHPADALRELEAKLIIESMDCPLGDGPAPIRLDDASFPWFRFGVESSMKRTEYRVAGYRSRESGRVGRFVEFLASGRSLGKIVLDDDREFRDSDPDLRPLILWAEYLVGLGESAIAGTAGGDKPRFREPKRGLSKKAAAVREILIDAWPEVRTGPEIVSELDKRGLDETTAHLSDRIFPELEEAGCPVVNLGRGYYLLPSFVGN